MTEASAGLRKALARKAGVSKLTTEELLAEMTDEQKAEMAAAFAPAAVVKDMPPKKDGEDEEDESEMGDKPKSEKEKDEHMGDDDKAKASAERAIAVLSHEHAQGRMDVAKTLLANDKLSADDIIKVLAIAAPAAPADPEAAAREEMKSVLKETGAPEIEANNGGASPSSGDSASIWDKTYAKLGLAKPSA